MLVQAVVRDMVAGVANVLSLFASLGQQYDMRGAYRCYQISFISTEGYGK